ncbi:MULTISPECIES: hypothetical protein [Haloarcula]|uniref:hypothetical protein n=1 Tax=Haloarcula TaxID=2237 RepID=UPI0023EB421A|nr:hypothetical protein [Halomicroarcula sp. XH51]
MHGGDLAIEEIFRFEYHPIEDVPRRFRIVMVPGSSDIRRLSERYTGDGWRVLDSQPIEYFEFSDSEAKAQLE